MSRPSKFTMYHSQRYDVDVQLYLDKHSMRFSATVNDNDLVSETGDGLKRLIEEELAKAASTTFEPVIVFTMRSVYSRPNRTDRRDDMWRTRGGDAASITATINRYHVARKPLSKPGQHESPFLRCDWETPIPDRAKASHDAWFKIDSVPGWYYSGAGNEVTFVYPYTEALWESLRDQMRRLNAASDALLDELNTYLPLGMKQPN